MSIVKRFSEIMSANVNALLDLCEDPGKMADQTMRRLERDLAKVKAETAEVMANARVAERKLHACMEEAESLEEIAKKALLAGNEEDARKLICKKEELKVKIQSLEKCCEAAKANAEQMRQMHDKISADISILNERRDLIKAKNAIAKSQEHFNKMTSNTYSITGSMSAFDKWENKTNRRLDAAEAMAELNSQKDEVGELKAKYTLPEVTGVKVEDEIAKLKQELGL